MEKKKKLKGGSFLIRDLGIRGSLVQFQGFCPRGRSFFFPFQSENCCAGEISFSSVSEQHPKAIIPFPKERNSQKV